MNPAKGSINVSPRRRKRTRLRKRKLRENAQERVQRTAGRQMLLLDEENIARCANEDVTELGKHVAEALD